MDSLVDGEAEEEDYAVLVRNELSSGVETGGVAATLVAALLLFEGTGLGLLLVSVAGAFALGFLAQLGVFVAGIALVKWRADDEELSPADPAHELAD
jgi:hypothetical protein